MGTMSSIIVFSVKKETYAVWYTYLVSKGVEQFLVRTLHSLKLLFEPAREYKMYINLSNAIRFSAHLLSHIIILRCSKLGQVFTTLDLPNEAIPIPP